ncbi:MAG: hypothetical protein AAF721_36550 [Myxococcota bacterium]
MTDDALLDAFDRATLTPETFGHRQHVRLSWLQVTRLPLLEAIRRHCVGLRRLADAFGASGKFHVTITVAWLLVIHDRASRGDATTFAEFAARNPDLLSSDGAPLAAHFSVDCLRSAEARAHFAIPDRAYGDVTERTGGRTAP